MVQKKEELQTRWILQGVYFKSEMHVKEPAKHDGKTSHVTTNFLI